MTWRAAVMTWLALVATACTPLGAPSAPLVGGSAESAVATIAPEPTDAPEGRVVVAYPDPPATWWGRDEDDLAAIDLASLWMLPMYRIDPLGRLVPALAQEARPVTPDEADGDARWGIRVVLAPGSWSDGRAVTAADVVATAEVLAEARPAAWGAFVRAEVVERDVVLWFDRPFAGWPWLLSVAPGVLPAHVLAEDGLDAYEDSVSVSGGWFVVGAQEPGLRVELTAHAGSPLGAPGLESLELLVVPDHDVALGLLDRGEADVVLGHVALDPSARRALVTGAVGEVSFGGSRFELVWDADAGADLVARRGVHDRLDPTPLVEGLLRDVGRPAGGLLPAMSGAAARADDDPREASVRVQVPRTVEGLGLLARLLQSTAARAGIAVELVRVDPPQHLEPPVDVDGRLRLARVVPGRSVAALMAGAGLDPAAGLDADAAGLPDRDPSGPAVPAPTSWVPAVEALLDDAWLTPIAEVGVAHAWMPDRVAGVTPSGWPGIALWDVGVWQLPEG